MQLFHGPLTAVLCLSLVVPPLPAESPAPDPATPDQAAKRSTNRSAELQGDARILHALNRFTFGPKPGDVDAVHAMGLEKWLDQQLHPASIAEADLNARLAEFPAMQWSPEELLFRVPSNAIIRQALDGKLPVPERGALHSVYENQMYRAGIKKQEKEQKQAAEQQKQLAAAKPAEMAPGDASVPMSGGETNATQPGTQQQAAMATPSVMSSPPPSATAAPPVNDGQYRRFLDLPPQQRVQQLTEMQPETFDAFFKSLKPQQRASLLQDLTPDLKEVALDLENPQRLVNEEIIAQRLTRDIYSNAQLQEVMTDFWLNHFNVFLHKNEQTPYYLVEL